MSEGTAKKPIYKRVWFWIIVAIVVIGLIGAVGGRGGSSSSEESSSTSSNTEQVATTEEKSEATEEPAAAESESKDFEISGEEMEKDKYGLYKITGTFTNNSGKDYSYVQLSYAMYDEDGVKVGDAFANTNKLADGKSWKFEASCLETDEDIDDYELTDVTAF